MCGIAGILKLDTAAPDIASSLHKMADSIRHRGPDDEGYVCFGGNNLYVCGGRDTQTASREMKLPYAVQHDIDNIGGDMFLGMAHRRLSVIDLSSAGHQPMCNDNKTIWVVFNGEIYNYWEIREELEENSVHFVSSSDVEVMLKAYEYWGMRFLDKLNGMWSFVLYDLNANFLIGCRDRFGVKPFYYYNSKQYFAFASEQKALLQLPVNTSVSSDAVFDYLVNSSIERTENGLYTNIKELMPAHYFIYDLNSNQFEITKYYNLSFNKSRENFSAERCAAIVSQVEEKINHAVTIRLRSDVNVGFCLSGGIDSSSIIGVSQKINAQHPLRQLNGTLHAFTASCDNESVNESHWAGQVVEKHGLSWHKCACTSSDLFDELEKIIYYQDSPLFSTSTYAQSSVMKLAHENNITILLDGQGGDELFAGYVPFYISYYYELLRRFQLKTLGSEIANLKNSPLDFKILLRSMGKVMLSDMLPGPLQSKLAKNNHKEISFLSKNLLESSSAGLTLNSGYSSKDLNSALFDYFTNGYLRNLLRWEDRCSMQYSVESRTPFADDIELIEYMFSLPSVYKIHKGRSKYLLRKAMVDVLPEGIYRRSDKLGFSTPQSQWLMQSEKRMKTIISELAVLDTEKFVNANSILENWVAVFSGNKNPKLMDFAWRYMNFLIWRKVNGL